MRLCPYLFFPTNDVLWPAEVTMFRPALPLLAFTFLLTGLSSAQAQGQLNWAQKMFEKQSHDFGVVARGADVRYRLAFKNLYKEPLHVANVRTSCGCSAAKPSKTSVASLETAYIEISMDTRKFTRRKDASVIITFDAPLYQEVRIPITAYIRTDVVLTPGSANFGTVDLGAGATQTLDVAYAGRNDWTIREVRTNNSHLTGTVTETGRAGGRVNYKLHLTLDPDAPAGKLSQQITLITDDANSPYVPVLVEGVVQPDIVVTPALVSLGMLTPGREKTFNVVIRGRKPFAIEKIECESDRECFKVRLPTTTRPVHVVPLTVTPPEGAGTLDEEFTVTIGGRDQTLSFKAYGKVVDSAIN